MNTQYTANNFSSCQLSSFKPLTCLSQPKNPSYSYHTIGGFSFIDLERHLFDLCYPVEPEVQVGRRSILTLRKKYLAAVN